MTLEELKNKTVTITVNKSFKLGEDIQDYILQEILDDLEGTSNQDIIDTVIDTFYSYEFMKDILDGNDYDVSVQYE